MKNNLRQCFRIIALQLIFVLSAPALAVPTEILDINAVNDADVNALVEDSKTFSTIGMGIALSIAQCDGQDICDPSVNENEIGQLIDAIDMRIEGIVRRQEANAEDLNTIITAYIDTREQYTDYMDRLSKITKTPEPEISEEEFAAEEDIFADDEALTEDEYSAFEDFDESLEDDESLEEFEDEDVLDEL